MTSLIIVITCRSGLANAVEMALPGEDYQVILARDATHAHDCLQGMTPALILLGETVQSMYQQTTLLRTHPLTAHVPILLQSDDFAVHNPDYQERLGVQGALDNLYSTREVLDSIRRLMSDAA